MDTWFKACFFEFLKWDAALVWAPVKEGFLVSMWDLCQTNAVRNLDSSWFVEVISVYKANIG